MLATRSRAALGTLLLAVLASTALAVAEVVGTASATEEQVSVLLWVAGWVLLVWAALLGVSATVRLVRAGRRADAALAVLGLAGVAAVAVLHPIAGSGGAAG